VLLLGVCVQLWVAEHIAALEALAKSEPFMARVVAEDGLRRLSRFLAGFCVFSSALLARYFQLGLRQGRVPPHGWWSLGSHRAATGTTARRLGRVGLCLAALLSLLGVAAMLLMEHLIESLLHAQRAA
jgi:hypothetical protein